MKKKSPPSPSIKKTPLEKQYDELMKSYLTPHRIDTSFSSGRTEERKVINTYATYGGVNERPLF